MDGRNKQATALIHLTQGKQLWRTVALEDTEDLVTSHEADLGNTVAVPQDDTDLGGSQALPGELHDVVHDVVGSGLEPRRGSATVGESRRGCTIYFSAIQHHEQHWHVQIPFPGACIRPMVARF